MIQAMKNNLKIQLYLIGIALLLGTLSGYSQQADSLDYYLETAARNNPLVNSNFALYKASLEKFHKREPTPIRNWI